MAGHPVCRSLIVLALCLWANPAVCRGPTEIRKTLVVEGEDVMIESYGARRIVRLGQTSIIGYAEKLGDKWRIRARYSGPATFGGSPVRGLHPASGGDCPRAQPPRL